MNIIVLKYSNDRILNDYLCDINIFGDDLLLQITSENNKLLLLKEYFAT